MIERICHINNEIDDSVFLLGARQTGKSTFLRQTFPDCTYIGAIEIKSVEEVLPRHTKGLQSFASDCPETRLIVVSLDPINRRMGNVECIYVLDFFKKLRKNEI